MTRLPVSAASVVKRRRSTERRHRLRRWICRSVTPFLSQSYTGSSYSGRACPIRRSLRSPVTCGTGKILRPYPPSGQSGSLPQGWNIRTHKSAPEKDLPACHAADVPAVGTDKRRAVPKAHSLYIRKKLSPDIMASARAA